jgi:hypothetical protein
MRKVRRQNNFLFILLVIGWMFFGIQSFFSAEGQTAFIFFLAILFFSFSFFSSMLVFSCFIIPIQDPADLFSVFTRIIRFFLRLHGPIQQIKNGQMETIYAGIDSNLPGLALLDSASAAIISHTTSYHRTVGPGVCFLQKNEKISHTSNLSLQKKWIGPLENENPFLSKVRGESSEGYQSRLKRAEETTAFTADGKKIIASFLVFIKFIANSGEGGSPFGYNPISVNRAFLGGSPSLLIKNQLNSYNWFDLPGILVSDLWKDEISKFRFNNLFSQKDAKLNDCVNAIQNRLVEKSFSEKQEVVSNNQFQGSSLLQERGLVIRKIYLMKVYLDNNLENKSDSLQG